MTSDSVFHLEALDESWVYCLICHLPLNVLFSSTLLLTSISIHDSSYAPLQPVLFTYFYFFFVEWKSWNAAHEVLLFLLFRVFLFFIYCALTATALYLCVIAPAYVEIWDFALPQLFTPCHTWIDFGFYGGNRASLTRRYPSGGDGNTHPPFKVRTEVFTLAVGETNRAQSVICDDFYISSGFEGFAADARGRKRALLKGNLFSLSLCWLKSDDKCDLVVYGAGLTASGAVFLWGSWVCLFFFILRRSIVVWQWRSKALLLTSCFSQVSACDLLTSLS